MQTEFLIVGVVMQRRLLNNPWQPHAWRPMAVLTDADPAAGMQHLLDEEADARWLHRGFEVGLYRDEAEGYHLNATAPAPCWFIMWRIEEVDGADIAVPKRVTLSYNEAARMMDGGEQVDTLPLDTDTLAALSDFAAAHYRPEPKGKRRRPSFEGGAAVQRMAADGGNDER
ncbi:DUF3305 domain-containing protein [Noviherbaspirillum pedocola]|uniref:DUF3305 domain-containing protein n=1 Tax=Noviherbaspirillum pedocola TaxID=2801341 RepID=A0A934SRZ1_9BURK|nr:DUF3305 domain-containing protein [Noviherbaspirillum pedocola]MBK4734497.1 DUF3305 domain-containing protein [Noviherbaspirillum pedocola]